MADICSSCGIQDHSVGGMLVNNKIILTGTTHNSSSEHIHTTKTEVLPAAAAT